MTWQEELRQLDSALAGGELSANEYRKRRDEILAAASSAQPPSPVLGPPTGPQPVVGPDGEANGNGSENGNGSGSANGNGGGESENADNAEVTQVVNVEAVEAEQTQIIDAVTAGGGDTKAANGDAERTQVVTAEAPAAHQQPQQQMPQQPMWATQLPDPSAPTGVFPRQQQMAGPAVTPMDAQDLFTSNKPPRGGRKPLLIVLTVLVVLALVGGAVWFFGFQGDDTKQTADDDKQTTTQEQPAPEPVDITKIELPGEPAANAGEMDISRASELKVIAPAEATLLAGAGADAVVYSGAAEGDYRFLLYSFKSKDAKAAEELTGKVIDVQKQLGFADTEVDGVPESVDVSAVSNAQAAAMRGVYTYGDTTIQLCVLQVPTGDVDEMRVQFQRAMTAITDAAPPAK